MKRNWRPCRICGSRHTNPMSSTICQACGQAEREERLRREAAEMAAYESSPFGQFMSMSEDDRWRMVFDLIEAR